MANVDRGIGMAPLQKGTERFEPRRRVRRELVRLIGNMPQVEPRIGGKLAQDLAVHHAEAVVDEEGAFPVDPYRHQNASRVLLTIIQ